MLENLQIFKEDVKNYQCMHTAELFTECDIINSNLV